MQPDNYAPLLTKQLAETLTQDMQVGEILQPLLRLVNSTYLEKDNYAHDLQAKVDLRTEQLIASTSRAYSFLDTLHMGFILCDLTAEMVVINRAVKRMLGFDVRADDLSMDKINALFQPDLELRQLVMNSLSSRQAIEAKEVKTAQRVLHLSIAPIGNEAGHGDDYQPIGAALLFEDITEQKVLDRSKDEFLSIASHELRTPLTAIRGNASLLREYYNDQLPVDTVEIINDIHESAIRLIDIVNDFLDASSLEQGKMRLTAAAFALSPVVEGVLRELRGVADPKGLTLVSNPALASLPNVWADQQRIKQVLYNLIGNAIKFTEHGGIQVSGHTDDTLVYLTVTDTGRGMALENQRLLFRKFQQAGTSILSRDATKGTGLGLYISKLIIDQSSGSICLKSSEPGRGSSFEFSLPQANTVSA